MAKKNPIMAYFVGLSALKQSDKQQADILFEHAVERLVRTGKVTQRGVRRVLSKYNPTTARVINSARVAALKAPLIIDTIKNLELNEQSAVISGAETMQSPSKIAFDLMNAKLVQRKDIIQEILTDWSKDSKEIGYVIALKDLPDPEASEMKASICYDADDVEYEMENNVTIRVQFVPLYLIDRYRPSHTDASAALSGSGQGE